MKMRVRLALVGSACLGGLVVMGSSLAVVLGGGSGTTTPADVLYLSPTGSDSNPCTKARPCLSFSRVWDLSKAGQIVELAAGTYGPQRIGPYLLAAPRADVVFRPAKGADVVTGEVEIEGSHIEFRDLTLGGWKTFERADDVTFRNVATRHFFIWSSSNVRILGGSVGPNLQATYDSNITTATGSQKPPTGILIDRVHFHDWIDPDPGQANHIECLQVGSGVNVTIRRSRFERCGTHDIFIRSWGGLNGGVHTLQNWLIENNFFGRTLHGYYAIQFGNDLGSNNADLILRHNSFLQGVNFDAPSTTVTVDSNIFSEQASWSCTADTYRYNVYESILGTGRRCGSTDKVARVKYVDRAALDLHLSPRSAAINSGNPRSETAVDIDGQARPLGTRADAGADEALVPKRPAKRKQRS